MSTVSTEKQVWIIIFNNATWDKFFKPRELSNLNICTKINVSEMCGNKIKKSFKNI